MSGSATYNGNPAVGGGPATQIRETGGPTVLTVTAIADGQSFLRSGSNLVGFTPVGSDRLVGVSGTDTTSSFLVNKLVALAGHVTLAILNGGGNEQLRVSLPDVGPGAATIGTAGLTSITLDTQGRVTAATAAALVPQTRTLTAGAGLTGTGDLSADRTLNVVANADGSIVVNADGVQVGVLATDAQHGNRGGGTVHAVAVASGAAGFLSGTDKAKLDGVASSAAAVASSTPANVGTAAAGVAVTASRSDHIHALPAMGPGAVTTGGAAQLIRSIQTDANGRTVAITATDLSGVTGLLKSTAGTLAAAGAGVDFSKGPYKAFSTVRNGSAAQTLSIPVVDGENNGLIRATGRIISDGTDRTLTIKINGSATNVIMQRLTSINSTPGAQAGNVGVTRNNPCHFTLVMSTAHTANSIKRAGIFTLVSYDGSAILLTISGFYFNDTTTTITSIDIDCANATGLAANTEAMVQEGIMG